MPSVASAAAVITGFSRVPPFARGLVRDMRVRWACEEIGRPYRMELIDAFAPRSAEYRARQPFGQVPAFTDGNVDLFESGAILLYLGEQDESLLPHAGETRWKAISWLFAALNSVEPMLMQIVNLDVFNAGKDWAAAARPNVVELATARLKSLSDALGGREWLAGPFTIADIAMVTVLRNLNHTDILAGFPNVAGYKARGEARPAFRSALDAQLVELDRGDSA